MSQFNDIDKTLENVRWDLTDLYSDVDDQQIDRDLETLIQKLEQFQANHAGNLSNNAG